MATSSSAGASAGSGFEAAEHTRVWVAVAGSEQVEFIHSALTQAGMRPLDLDNAAEVLAWRDRPRRGAAVVDFSLPGAALLCQVLTAGSVYSPGVPVLAVLPDDTDTTLQSAFDAGAADFMLHPITPARLTHRMRFLLRAEDQRSALAESQRHLATVKRIARITYWEVDAADQLVWGNHAARVLGLAGDDVPRSLEALAALAHAEDRPGLEAALKSGEPFALDWRCADASGRWLTLHQHAEVVERRGDLALLGGTLQDVTELRRAETTIARMKTRDALTGLGNRQHVIGEITHLLGDAHRSGRKLAVIRLDISDFKRINHSYGMSAGDEVLRRLAARLSGLVRRGPLHVDALASLGGDEFIAVVADLETPEALEAHLRCLRANCMVPIPLELLTGASEVVLRVRMGVAFFPEDGEDPETLLSNAGIAVAEAKRRNPAGDAFFFSAELNSRARERVALESDLRLAVELGELQLAFQPKVSARNGQVVGAEALVRWHHMEHGDVSPGRFIGLAEESGIITELGAWILERSCRAAFDWQRRWQRSLTVAVNVSVEQLRRCDFPSVVERVLAQTGLAPELLELEITEGIMLVGEDSLELMRRLAALGVKLSIDDFGTGYSSLAYLKRLPIDTVKIDQSFVRSMLTVYDDKAIVEAIISLGHSLELNIVAEGVETAEQADLLAELGCDVFQGYHFGRPMSPARWVRWLDGKLSVDTTLELVGRPGVGS